MDHLTCQSCGLPFTNEISGTNRDESENEDYCVHCFEHGEFVDQSLTLHGLEVKLVEMAEMHNEITREEAVIVIRELPYLKRWHMNIM
tara:strand:+ start:114095 stop:114358 length:264 start_codon:yes stop_codon:yes gene_type:complete